MVKYSAAAWTDRSLVRGRHSVVHRVWPGWCRKYHQAGRSLCYGDKRMDGNELAKTEWWKDSLVAVTDTYSGTSLQHQRYYYWWQQHHSISLSSQPWWHFWWTFDHGGACQQCLPIFFFHLHNISSIRRVLDMIAKAGRRDHISPILFKLHWLPDEFRIKYKILLLTYRALHDLLHHRAASALYTTQNTAFVHRAAFGSPKVQT